MASGWKRVATPKGEGIGGVEIVGVPRDERDSGGGKSAPGIEWTLPPLYEVRLEPANREKPLRFALTRLDPAGD